MRTILFGFLAICVLTTGVWAKDIALDKKEAQPTGVFLMADEVKNKVGPALQFKAHVSKLSFSEVKTEAGTFTRLDFPGAQLNGQLGAPAIPVIHRLVEVPLGAQVEVTATGSDRQTYTLQELGITSPLHPRQPSQPKSGAPVPFAFEKRAYLAKGFVAEDLVSVEEVGLMRDRRLVLLKVAPVAYDAAEGRLEIRNDIQVKMTLKNPDLAATAKLKKTYGSPFFTFPKDAVVIPPSIAALEETAACRASVYVIVADRMFENDLKPFIAWKTAKGFRVIVGYTDQIGKTSDQIKAYIADLYKNPGEIGAPDYVLFVGDNEQIPAFKGKSGSHITDLYFVAVTPGDNIPDILTGRFSAQKSEELIPQLEKTMEYEQYAFADPSFLKSAVMIAGWDSGHTVEWGWPQINYGTKYFFNAEHGMGDTKSFLVAGSHQSESEIRKAVSDGTVYLNYTAHGSQTSWGDPSFTIPQINALANKGKYPLVVGNCCLTNSFQVSACFGEAWLRAKDKGAIGYLGGSNSTYWDEDLWWGTGLYPIAHPNPQGLPPKPEDTKHGAYEGVFSEGYCSNAALNLAGNLAVQASSSSRKLYYWEIYHLMGDPSLMIYLGVPKDNAVEVPATLAMASTTLEIKTAPKACVGVTMNGELLGAACADAAGLCVVQLAKIPAAGDLKVVVTGQNLKPFIGSVKVE
jgi:hypothetical protein